MRCFESGYMFLNPNPRSDRKSPQVITDTNLCRRDEIRKCIIWFSIALGILVLIFMQTGALSLMTLMLAGVMRGQAVPPAESYQAPIDRVLATHPAVTSAVTPVGKTADGGAGA